MDEFTALAIDENENVYLTGSVKEATTGFFDYKTFKLDAGLQILWEKVYAGSAGKDDMARAIGVDDSGNVYVSGFSVNGNGDKDYLTIKYNASGTTQWTKKYDGLSDDEANSLAINEGRNISVRALDERETYYNFFKPHIEEGRTNVRLYKKLIYLEIYDGIDLVISSNQSASKYYFLCKPGSSTGCPSKW